MNLIKMDKQQHKYTGEVTKKCDPALKNTDVPCLREVQTVPETRGVKLERHFRCTSWLWSASISVPEVKMGSQ